MDTKEKQATKMLAAIRKTVKRLKIKLSPLEFVWRPTARHAVRCCALGAALALKTKTKDELIKLAEQQMNGEGWHETRPVFVARLLNGRTTVADMFQLESGFEDWSLVEQVENGTCIRTDENHSFYKIGAKLRKDAMKAKR